MIVLIEKLCHAILDKGQCGGEHYSDPGPKPAIQVYRNLDLDPYGFEFRSNGVRDPDAEIYQDRTQNMVLIQTKMPK